MEENISSSVNSTFQILPMQEHPAVLAVLHIMYKIGEF